MLSSHISSLHDLHFPTKIRTKRFSISLHFQAESKQTPSKSQTGTTFLPIAALRFTPVALALLDLEVVLITGVALAVGVVLIGSGPVILTSPSSPPTRQAMAYWFQSATLDKQELTFGYATIISYVAVVVEVIVSRAEPSVG